MKTYTLWPLFWLLSIFRAISANVTQTPKRHPVFLPDCTNFQEITDCYAFVDKTQFIEAFLNYKSCNYHLFTRPRKFGKSTNMDMLKRFVQLEVNQNGRVKKQNETSNYRLFTNRTLNLHIARYPDIINGYLGKYPVIHIEFKGVMRDSFNETLKNIRDRVRKACSPYEWMIEILKNRYQRTNDTNILQQVRFLRKAIYGAMNLDITTKSLSLLAKVLVNYFGRKLFVFIDDYDEAIDYGLRYAHRVKYDATKIRSVMSTMMGKLFDQFEYIEYVMITGLARGSSSMLDSFGVDFEHHRFLYGSKMSTFFGFTEEQVARVMAKRRIELTERHKVIEYYNGFFTTVRSIRMYNTNGVLNYLGSFKKYNITYPLVWIDPGSLDFMQEAMKNPIIYLFWLQIVLEKTGTFVEKTYVEEMRMLKLSAKLKSHLDLKSSEIEAFFWYCKENGYIISGGSPSSDLQCLPNKETEVEFTNVLFKYYDSMIPNITAPLTETFKNLAVFVNIDDEVPNLKRRLEALIRSEFKFNMCKELHYYGLIYHAVASYFKDVFVDIKVLSQDTAYYIVVCEKEEVVVIAVKYERGIKKALRQAFNYHTEKKLTKGKNIRFIGIKINLKTEIVSIAYFSPYNRISVSFAVESEERESGLYDMFQVF